ncbi:N-acetyl-gamma-glutamyl-phosphate reductase [Actinospongicola halichondriae]|uniref:N-acetyl-gamma-glutamyl-phosphate reductase n=1 Tax=Actinospongicola halichondriae TaxID=3236844 RepID=UPI003D4266D6
MANTISVGILGASGFAGSELLRLLAVHPDFEVRLAGADSQAGTAVADLYPGLAAAYPDLRFTAAGAADCAGLDLVFLGLPHGLSQSIVPELRGQVKWIVDAASDFRLKDPSLYPQWYGSEHPAPELLVDAAYGIPELFREQIAATDLVAVAGCYPTGAALAIAPFVRAGLIDTTNVIVNSATGLSGAGRPPKEHTTFCAADENYTAYGLLNHRHTPEIEQATGAEVLFTPHLAPMNRGIFTTAYARPVGDTSTEALLACLHDTYAGEPFMVVDERIPSTKAAQGSNTAHLTARFDERTGFVLLLSAIDNLVKGTSGQAIQCANILAGIPETTGLPLVGLMP